MKYFMKKNYLILLLIIILFHDQTALAIEGKVKYSRNNIANYFSGIISAQHSHSKSAFKHLNKVQSLKNNHKNYNIQFLRTLVLLEKFDQAVSFSKSIWLEEEFLFEADLVLGIDFMINKNYIEAEKHFKRLNKTYERNMIFADLFGNILLAWSKASQNNKEESLKIINKIPDNYRYLTQIQKNFLKCYFDVSDLTLEDYFQDLLNDEDYNFSRYSFFYINYLLHKTKKTEAEKIIAKSRKKYSSNLLLRETEIFILNEDIQKIKNLFNCKNPLNVIAEFFYIVANLYSSEQEYERSNFYLNISLFLNGRFSPNKALLAENLYYQKKYEDSLKIYNSLKSIGPSYSWYSSKSIAAILLETKGKDKSISSLEKEFNLIKNPNFEHYYELANVYKDNENYKNSIKYYSLALQNIEYDHYLIPKILDRRGTSYERLGEWEKAEKDLTESLKISPDEPYVLNYLAYSWVEKKINLKKALEMLERATNLRKNDGYIIDSLGWAYYAMENYVNAEKFLQKAVQLKPLDPIINDHYADALWMLNKNIQARYVWQHVLNLKDTEQELKDNINRKLIFGINSEL